MLDHLMAFKATICPSVAVQPWHTSSLSTVHNTMSLIDGDRVFAESSGTMAVVDRNFSQTFYDMTFMEVAYEDLAFVRIWAR